MTASTTMTIRMSSDTKSKLERIAVDTRRSQSFIAAEAIAAYVERELATIEGIKRGIVDAGEGRVVSHTEAEAELHGVIDAAEMRRAGRR